MKTQITTQWKKKLNKSGIVENDRFEIYSSKYLAELEKELDETITWYVKPPAVIPNKKYTLSLYENPFDKWVSYIGFNRLSDIYEYLSKRNDIQLA